MQGDGRVTDEDSWGHLKARFLILKEGNQSQWRSSTDYHVSHVTLILHVVAAYRLSPKAMLLYGLPSLRTGSGRGQDM